MTVLIFISSESNTFLVLVLHFYFVSFRLEFVILNLVRVRGECVRVAVLAFARAYF